MVNLEKEKQLKRFFILDVLTFIVFAGILIFALDFYLSTQTNNVSLTQSELDKLKARISTLEQKLSGVNQDKSN
jgi:uncharacterized protein YigA (DUF484 family)